MEGSLGTKDNTMKKLFTILLVLCSLSGVGLGQQLLRQSTATTIDIGPFEDSSGAATNPTVTNITVVWRKQGDTTSTSSTTWTPTASGGSHDCVTDTNDTSLKNCEITATDTDTAGRITITAAVSGSLKYFGRFVVVPAATYDTLITNGFASGADLLNTQTSLLTDVGGFGKQVVDNVDSPASGIKSDTSALVTTIGTPTGASISADIVGVLHPTISGRTLDVTSTGAAGIDWGNVENPTTSINFTNTTIGTVTAVTGITGVTFPTNFNLLSINGSGQITVGTNNDKTGYALSSGNVTTVADAIQNYTIEGSLTQKQLTRLISAVLVGKSSGAGTGTITFRDVNDFANRVVATVSGGNRTAVTLNP